MPKTVVIVSGHLTIARQSPQRLLLPNGRIALDVVEHSGLENEETAVDPCAVRLLAKARDPAIILRQGHDAEPARRLRRGHRRQRPLRLVKGDQSGNVDVGY